MVSTSLLGKGFPGDSSGSCALEVDMSGCLSAHRSDMRERPCLSALALRDSFSLACCLSSSILPCFDSCACLCPLLSLALAWIAILLAVVLFSIGASLFPFIEHNDSNRAFWSNSLPKEFSLIGWHQMPVAVNVLYGYYSVPVAS